MTAEQAKSIKITNPETTSPMESNRINPSDSKIEDVVKIDDKSILAELKGTEMGESSQSEIEKEASDIMSQTRSQPSDKSEDSVANNHDSRLEMHDKSPRNGDMHTSLCEQSDVRKAGNVVLPLIRDGKQDPERPATCKTMVTVHGIGVDSLIDTGATCTMLSYTAYDRINSYMKLQLDSTTRSFHGATGTNLKIYGKVIDLPIMLGGQIFPTDAIVCDLVGMECLLGMDFLKKHHAVVDIGQSTITLRGPTSAVTEFKEPDSIGSYAVVMHNTTIPGGQTTEVKIRHKWESHETVGVFEPLVSMGDYIYISSQLIHPEKDCSSICVENRSEVTVTVPRSQILGVVDQISQAKTENHEVVYAVYETRSVYHPPQSNHNAQQRLHITRSGFGLIREKSTGDYGPKSLECEQNSDGLFWDNQYLESLGAFPEQVSIPELCVEPGFRVGRIPDPENEIDVNLVRPTKLDTISRGTEESLSTGKLGTDNRFMGPRLGYSREAVERQESEIQNMVLPVMALTKVEIPEKSDKDGKARDRIKSVTKHYSTLPEHLRCMLPRSDSLTAVQAKDLVSLVNQYTDVFVGPDGKVGYTDLTTHVIDTGNELPCKQPPRRTGFAEKQVIEDTIADLLATGKIRPSSSAWASPIVLVRKKDGSMRFCIDYRRLNDKTKKDAYPLPKIDEALNQLAGSRYWSCLDLASGYWQVAMHPESVAQTGFCTHMGLFEWLVMPFGLCNAPAVFERLMDKVLQGLQWHDILVYLDDIMAYGPTFGRALERLSKVFQRLRTANLKLKPKKCFLMAQEVDYLGHHITREGVSPLHSKVSAITHWKVPEDLGELRSFLGLACYYRRFVDDYSGIASPLTELLRKDVKYEWNSVRQKAFDDLRTALITAPILAFPKPGCKFMLDTDASDKALGGVLSQIQDGEERVIAFYSKTLDRTQQRYCTTKRELLAIKACIETWEHFLRLEEFGLRTDHQALKWVSTMKCRDTTMLRWASYVKEYNFLLEHRPGKLHGNADALSRKGYTKCGIERCRECYAHSTFVERDDDNELPAVFAITRSKTKQNSEPQTHVKPKVPAKGSRNTSVMPENSQKAKTDRCETTITRRVQPTREAKRKTQIPKTKPGSVGDELHMGQKLKTETDGRRLRSHSKQQSCKSDLSGEPKNACESRDKPMSDDNRIEHNQSPTVNIRNREEVLKESESDRKASNPPRRGRGRPRKNVVEGSESRKRTRHRHRKRNHKPSNTESQVDMSEDRVSDLNDIVTDSNLERGMFNNLDHLTNDEWLQEQKCDPTISTLNSLKRRAPNGKRPEGKERTCLSQELKQLCYLWDSLVMVNGLWCRVFTDPDTEGEIVQRIVPYRFRRVIFNALHGRPECGHFGYERVHHLASLRFFWIGISSDLRLWLKSCDTCQKIKPGLGKGRYPLVQEQSGSALERCAMDFSGPWPITKAGNQYILVLQDYFTKWLELWALPDRKASSVAKCLVEFMQRYGTIHKLHSDQGREFESNFIKEVCEMWGVKKTRTQPYTPWSDGMVERSNRTIHTLLKTNVNNLRDIWDKHLGKVMMAYNATIHTSTRYTPYKLMCSRCEDPELPLDFLFGTTVQFRHPSICTHTFVEESKSIAAKITKNVGQVLGRQAQTQARNHLRGGMRIREYKPGDMVLVYHPPDANQKLLKSWRGPFRVERVYMENLMVKILVPPDKIVSVHCCRIKPYIYFPIKECKDKRYGVSLVVENFSTKLHNEKHLQMPVRVPYGHPQLNYEK